MPRPRLPSIPLRNHTRSMFKESGNEVEVKLRSRGGVGYCTCSVFGEEEVEAIVCPRIKWSNPSEFFKKYA